jgi:hypothetical protein
MVNYSADASVLIMGQPDETGFMRGGQVWGGGSLEGALAYCGKEPIEMQARLTIATDEKAGLGKNLLQPDDWRPLLR